VTQVPPVVLTPDQLDVLELALSGALATVPDFTAGRIGVGNAVQLTDTENAPLAELRRAATERLELRALAELPEGRGPQWDPALRRPPALIREELRARLAEGAGSIVLALAIDDLPTRRDVLRLIDLVGPADVGAVVLATLSPRQAAPDGVGPAGRTRAMAALADELRGASPGLPLVPVVVPWPSAAAEPELDAVMRTYGATRVVRLAALRDAEDRATLARLATRGADAWAREVEALYLPAAAAEVLRVRRREARRGAVVMFSGLSGSGKSTIARALADELRDDGPWQVTLLDSDEARRLLSRDLGFDAASRDANITRLAYVGSLIAAHGGLAILAPIAPFAATRRAARALVEPHGAFLLVHVSTPLEVCEARDRKGMYARARAGDLPDFTGISSPYEPPDDADVTIDTTTTTVDAAVRHIRDALQQATDPAP
jgi:sulfate adenylyltransferase